VARTKVLLTKGRGSPKRWSERGRGATMTYRARKKRKRTSSGTTTLLPDWNEPRLLGKKGVKSGKRESGSPSSTQKKTPNELPIRTIWGMKGNKRKSSWQWEIRVLPRCLGREGQRTFERVGLKKKNGYERVFLVFQTADYDSGEEV